MFDLDGVDWTYRSATIDAGWENTVSREQVGVGSSLDSPWFTLRFFFGCSEIEDWAGLRELVGDEGSAEMEVRASVFMEEELPG